MSATTHLFIIVFLLSIYMCHSFVLKGFNYFPSQTEGQRMWCEFDARQIEKELDLARSIGANTVRTFIQFSLLENTECAPSFCPSVPRREILNRLDQFLTIADSKGIKVILGLFDEAEYLPFIVGTNHTQAAIKYVNHVLRFKSPFTGLPLGKDPRIIMWDLVNQLDDQSKQHPDGRPLILRHDASVVVNEDGMKWLKSVYHHVLSLMSSEHKVTFGAVNLDCAVYLIKHGFSKKIVPQYHEYLPYNYEGFAKKVEENTRFIKQMTGIEQVIIGETGAPSNLTDGHFVSWNEAKQKDYISTVLKASEQSGTVMGVMINNLMNNNFIGKEEIVDKYMGLYKAEAQPKLAVSVVRRYFMK